MCTDGTHKLNWNKLPAIVVGTVDTQQVFHMAALAIVSDEKTETYQRVLKSCADACYRLFGVQLAPKYGMSDNCDAIRYQYLVR